MTTSTSTTTHNYTPLTNPSARALPPEIPQFFSSFYRASDTPSAHGAYTSFFTPGATLIMGSKRGVGTAEILAIRTGMWELVEGRLHTLGKMFGWGGGDGDEGEEEVMLSGKVAYTLKDGRKAEVDWAARAELVKDEKGEWKMSFYQVYLDTAAAQNAK